MVSKDNSAVWHAMGFTTTPDERIGPGPPFATPALRANLICRVTLGILSLFITWVPARLLWRNGEFAGTVLCVTIMYLNIITVVNSSIWHDNNVQTWWAGYGWCDIQAYTFFAIHTAFNVSLFEIMRGLASKVSLRRTDKLTRHEVRRQRIISAAVIFSFPLIQVILNYFATVSRYNVSTLVGCSAVYYPNWIYLVFYIIPTPVFAVLAAVMAVVTFVRYRRVEHATRDIADSQGGVAAARRQRVRVKLYFMTLICIIFVLPIILVLMGFNIYEGSPWTLPYDYDALHFGPDPYNIYFISFTTSDRMSFPGLNLPFIGEIAGIGVAIPFGSSPEAINMYRKMLLLFGLGYLFPKLREEYVPRSEREASASWGSRSLRGKNLLGSNSTTSTRKDSILPTAERVSLASRADRANSSSTNQQAHPRGFTMGGDSLSFPEKTVASASAPHNNPWPDLSAADIDATTAQIEAGPAPPARNPYAILPTSFAKPGLKFPSLHAHSHKKTSLPQPHAVTATTTTTTTTTTTLPTIDNHTHAQSPPTTTTAATAAPATTTTTTPWQGGSMAGVVDTRVWASDSPPLVDPNTNTNTNTNTNSRRAYHDNDGGEEEEEEEEGDIDSHSPSCSYAVAARELQTETARTAGGETGGVRVETHIARRSMDVDVDLEGGEGEYMPYRVRVDRRNNNRSSDAAS